MWITATDAYADEAGDSGEFTISRDNTVGDLTVSFSVGGAAIEGDDYNSIGTDILLPSGDYSGTITINPIYDEIPEGDEDVTLTLTGVSDPSYTIGTDTDTVWISDGDSGGSGGNTPPVVTNPGDQNNAEGHIVSLQIDASDAEDDPGYLSFETYGLPPGLGISGNQISGKIDYSAVSAGFDDYNVTVTVTDTGGLTDETTFVWTVQNAAIGPLTVTEMYGSTELPNSLMVNGLTTEEIYISPDNTARMTIGPAPDAAMPDPADILFVLEGAGGSPSSGNFSTDPNISILGQTTIYVGLDRNGDHFLQVGEYDRAYVMFLIDLTGAVVNAQRTAPTDWAESLYPVKDGEHFDLESQFHFKLIGGTQGPRSMLTWKVLDTDGLFDDLIVAGGGNELTHRFRAGVAEGKVFVSFFVDKNGNGEWDSAEQYADSPVFWVQKQKWYDIKVDISSAIPGGVTTDQIWSVFDAASALLLKKDMPTTTVPPSNCDPQRLRTSQRQQWGVPDLILY